MERVEISRVWCGLLAMQVCAESDVTDEEILQKCNTENPSGTTNGWVQVVREDGKNEGQRPGSCEEYSGRIHFLVMC